MNLNIKNKLLCIILIIAIIISSTLCVPISADNKLDQMANQLSKLEQQEKELKAKLKEIESEKETSTEYQKLLEEQIKVTEQQILTARENITELNKSLLSLDEELKESRKEIEETLELLKVRIKALYKMGNVGTLQILFESESLNDYMRRTQLMHSMTERDKALMADISAYMEKTKEKRDLQEQQKAEVAKLKISLEVKSNELKVLEEENQALIKLLTEKELLVESELEEIYADSEALSGMMEYYIQQMIAAEANKPKPTPSATPTPAPSAEPTPTPSAEPTLAPTPTPEPSEEPSPEPSDVPTESPSEEPAPTPSEEPTPEPTPSATPTPTPAPTPTPEPSVPSINFSWPCPGYSYISAGWMGYPGHKGLDMAANYGTPIYAAESGSVMMANKTDEWGYSWGYYVSIYHNSTYSTLYAHCSSVVVNSGQWVEKGQLIAYVGSTGNSTGNHLHFEVYENGTRVDPMKFF